MSNRYTYAFLGVGILTIALLDIGSARPLTSLAEVATGEGILAFSNGENFQLRAVAVFLQENGQAEVRLMSEKASLSAGGRWFRVSDPKASIVIEITDDTDGGCAIGFGTVLLQGGCVPIARLTLTMWRLDGTTIQADFAEKNGRPCPRRPLDRRSAVR